MRRLAEGCDHLVHAHALELLVLADSRATPAACRPSRRLRCSGRTSSSPGMPLRISLSRRGRRDGILEARDQGLRAAFVGPRRDDARQVVLAGAIRVDVGLHLHALGARAGDRGDQLRHLAPHGVLGDLEMNDVHRHVRAASDLDGLGHRFENAAAFGAHVRRIAAAVGSGGLAHRHQGVGIDPRSRAARSASWLRRALPVPSPFARARASRSSSAEVGGPARSPRT